MMDLYQEMWTSKKVTGDDFCQCGSAGKHWQNHIMLNLVAYPCTACGCANKATVGGHIVSENFPEGYIVPLCDSCNQSDEPIKIKYGAPFVSADLSITCQKGDKPKAKTEDLPTEKTDVQDNEKIAVQADENIDDEDDFDLLNDYEKLCVLTGCECEFGSSVENYFKYREKGKKEGFIPVIVDTDDIFFEQLEALLKCDGENSISKIQKIVEEYHEKMLAMPVEDGKAYLEKNHIDGEWDDDVDLDGEEYEAEEHFTKGGYIVKVPVTEPWRIWAYLPYGGWNACPKVTEHMAVSKYLYEQYGAYPAALSYDTIDYAVEKPVEDLEKLANEIGTYCYDIVEQGCETYSALALELQNSRIWNLWWD